MEFWGSSESSDTALHSSEEPDNCELEGGEGGTFVRLAAHGRGVV